MLFKNLGENGIHLKERFRAIYNCRFNGYCLVLSRFLQYSISKIDPEIIILVHTENVECFKEMYVKKANILKKGEKYIKLFVI